MIIETDLLEDRITIKDENGKEISSFEIGYMSTVEDGICELLEYLNIEYEWSDV